MSTTKAQNYSAARTRNSRLSITRAVMSVAEERLTLVDDLEVGLSVLVEFPDASEQESGARVLRGKQTFPFQFGSVKSHVCL